MKPYKTFIFDSYSHNPETGTIELVYTLDGEIRFVETLTLPLGLPPAADKPGLQEALHALHMIGGISYYKTCLPKAMEVRTTPLTQAQAGFWNTMYEEGLGEFFYRNQVDFRGLIHFPFEPGVESGNPPPPPPREGEMKGKKVLVPMGGGKDSVVTAELLRKAGAKVTLFRVGQHPVIDRLAEAMGLPLLTVKRSLSPNLFKLNEEGAFNGHVPITGYLSFLAVAVALLGDFDAVAFSNEESASYGNVTYLGKEINHQWSKSLACEELIRQYIAAHIHPTLRYFSFLRNWSELDVVREFAKYPQYLPLTTSCNTNWRILSRDNAKLWPANRSAAPALPSDAPLRQGHGGQPPLRGGWCGECPKCAFVFALYSAVFPRNILQLTFGKDLFADAALLPLYRQLLGLEGFKPFECVGTPEETKEAFLLAYRRGEWQGAPVMAYFEEVLSPKS